MAEPVKEEVMFIGGQSTQCVLLGISPYRVSFNPHNYLAKEISFPTF